MLNGLILIDGHFRKAANTALISSFQGTWLARIKEHEKTGKVPHFSYPIANFPS